MRQIVQLMRVHQWVKNGFIFIPAFFAGKIFVSWVLLNLTIAFVAFSLMASCVYIINDYIDIPHDKLHPEKCKRPLASGAISRYQARIILLLLFAIALALALYLPAFALVTILGYFSMNLLYSFKLKHIAIIDVSIIAIGFLLRVALGGIAAGVPISHWLIMLTFLLAMLLGLAKRRDEFLIYLEGMNTRKSIEGYNLQFIDVSMMLASSVTVVTYIMYTVSEEVIDRIGNDNVYLTTLFPILGIMRYLQQTLVFTKTGSPTKILLSDRFIQLVILLWLLSFGVLLYS
ncbi:MAG: UbiA prenyltransferase family protein [Cyanobacteria bacterium P01_E01_bin.42]